MAKPATSDAPLKPVDYSGEYYLVICVYVCVFVCVHACEREFNRVSMQSGCLEFVGLCRESIIFNIFKCVLSVASQYIDTSFTFYRPYKQSDRFISKLY